MVVKKQGPWYGTRFFLGRIFLILVSSTNLVLFFLGIGDLGTTFYVGQGLLVLGIIIQILNEISNPLDWWYFLYNDQALPYDLNKTKEIVDWLKENNIRRCVLTNHFVDKWSGRARRDDLWPKYLAYRKVYFLRKEDALHYKLAWL